MEGTGTDDPYSWGVEAVVQHLCAPGCLWSRDPDSLAARLREEEIDGKTLLTFEQVCSRQELMGCLGVKIARHKAALVEVIVTLRSQSRGYWQWQQDFKRKNSSFCDEKAEELTESTAEHVHSPSGGRQKQNETFTPASVSIVGQHNVEERSTQQDTSANQISALQKDEQFNVGGGFRLSPTREAPNQETDERSVKRRRMAPTLLTEKPRDVAPAFIPTEADVLNYSFPGDPYPWESAPAYAYLGDGMIPQEAITSPEDNLSSLVREHNGSFDVNSLHMIPAGRRLVANRTLKRLFTGRYPIIRHSSSSPNRSDSSDKIYELADLGAEDFDDETRREIEEEELEKERLEALSEEAEPDPFVSAERVAEILNEAIEAVEGNWRERKLPRYERKAYSIWQKSRRHGTRKLQIRRAHEMATHLIDRIQKLCYEIQKQDWTSESPYRDAAKSLEQSLEDKMYQIWLIKILESSRPPPKPQASTRPKPPTVRQSSGFLQEEVLTSSDEDEFVVPDQADPVEEGPGEYQVSPIPVLKEESMDLDATFVDLTQDDSDNHDGLDLTHPIDLTTPVKQASKAWPKEIQREAVTRDFPETVALDGDISEPGVAETQPPENPVFESRSVERKADSIPKKSRYPSDSTNLELPPIENFGDLQKFALASLYKLAKNSDRWRLLIGEIWQMEHRRRQAAFDLILSDEPGVVWSKHIAPYLDTPVNDRQELEQDNFRTALFDVTRLCNCFFLCQHKTDEQMLNMKPSKIKKRITRPQSRLNIFEPFCLFVKLLAPHVPQDSQIYNTQETDILDDFFPEENDLDNLDDLDDVDGEEDRGRQRPKEKEIIRDKDAVDLREREKQRVQEQELRRAKLRATLASQPSAPGDGNRIIINESKEDDQGLIYINEHIARSIKQHQVDGVRFIWNQIVRDASVRQGCLLAHTMGLGKTMQVITVLVALAEASESQDPSVVAQIPADLRNSRTLVLCPASLVDNWMDELLKWAPVQALGELRKVTSSTPAPERSSTVTAWASDKGVLLVGYSMFQKLLDISEEVSSLLTEHPNVVVCDEAHALKNQKSKIHLSCSRFTTKSRIALTGSPLSNNVLEYFAMIDWVAPKFLGPYQEFRVIYSTPVERGLYHDSTVYDKRKAQKVLKALEQMVAPKVHRCTIAVLKDNLPPKQEFILFVPPTEPQKQLYQLYIKGVSREGGDSQADTFAAINHLGLICSHPKCFQAKIKKIQNGVSTSGDDDEKMTDKSFPKTMIPEFMKTLQSFRDISSPAFSWKTELLTTILNEARKVNDKVLIFSQSLDTLDYLQNMCNMQRRTVSRLDGNTPVAVRQQQVKDFNQGSKEVFLISTTAGGVGLNIQGANRVVIFDVRYNPAHEQQAVGRAYRIGQQKKVFVYRFMVAGTFEDNLNNRQVFKMQLASRVVDNKNPISWSKRKGDVVAEIRHRPAANLDPYVGKDQILDKLIKLRENGEAIRSIVSTDTFEEEDVSATLTEEEKREVEEMIKLSQLRVSHPEEYARLRNREDAALMEQIRLPREQEESSRPAPPQHAHRSFDGASDIPGDAQFPRTSSPSTHYQWDLPDTTRPPTFASQGPAPMPMAGANTFFGEHRSSETTIAQNVTPNATSRGLPQSLPPRGPSAGPSNIMQLANTSLNSPANRGPMLTENDGMQPYTNVIPKLNGVFSVTEIPARTDFETTLRKSIRNLQARNVPPARGDPSQLAGALTRRIDQIRKEAQFGLMPDTRHWKILNGFISHEKVVIAIISGYVSSEYLARAEAKELEERFEIINGLDETEIPARALDKVNSPDPIV
ncbi:hypothetical protein NW768_000617 [Fusarium equiseti]|uniref:DNA repair protein rhp54 n=1 Tax=Fusarium equiseti TaxID=61235 RepID=A0ABQ8RT24_FUSEQ|nr:hypothetical protein NW768_000617 [Fusarium equiseti]